jgi:3-hydroxybutyryl-CoA dehydrogenase
LSVTELAVATRTLKRVVGMHFFNPAPVLQFVEVIRTVITDRRRVLEDVKALAERLGKKPVVVGDKAGFIANALLFGYLNHAVSMYEHKYATREDIDAAMRFGCGYPMGPLALLDLIGLDTAYEILDTMYKQGRDRLHAPSPIIKQMVSAGLKGRKTGAGSTRMPGRLLRGRRRRAHPGDEAEDPGLGAPIARSASSARGRWPPGSSRSSPRPGMT